MIDKNMRIEIIREQWRTGTLPRDIEKKEKLKEDYSIFRDKHYWDERLA